MSSYQRVKTAVVGCGMISGIYLENMVNRFDILDVVACCDINSERAELRAQQVGIRVMSLEEILKDPEIELIVNLTTAGSHFEIISKALEAGKHVYTEKIVTPCFEDAITLKRLAEEKKLYLGCAPDTFLGAGLQNGRKAVEQGLIGRVTSCHVAVNRGMGHFYAMSPYMALPGGGIAYDVGIYYITALLSMFGPVTQVTGFSTTNDPVRIVENPALPNYGDEITIQSETLMVGCLKFENGILATLHFNGDSIWPEQQTIVLYGTEGILKFPNPDSFGGDTTLIKKGPAHSNNQAVLPNNYGYSNNSRGLGVAEMAWSIRKGRKHRASIDMACHAVEILNGIEKASKTGNVQYMTSTFEIPKILPEGYQENYLKRNPEGALANDR